MYLIRSLMRFVSYSDRTQVAAGLGPIYTAPTVEAAETALLDFAISDLGKKNIRPPSGRGSRPGNGSSRSWTSSRPPAR